MLIRGSPPLSKAADPGRLVEEIAVLEFLVAIGERDFERTSARNVHRRRDERNPQLTEERVHFRAEVVARAGVEAELITLLLRRIRELLELALADARNRC